MVSVNIPQKNFLIMFFICPHVSSVVDRELFSSSDCFQEVLRDFPIQVDMFARHFHPLAWEFGFRPSVTFTLSMIYEDTD